MNIPEISRDGISLEDQQRTLRQILPRLTAWFPPQSHVERELRGKGSWYFVPWQVIRQRLNDVCPGEWSVSYDEPKYLDKWCYINCTVVICGVPQQGLGSAEIEILSNQGKNAARGNPIERAIADAFKNACENFGIAAYLDDQSDPQKQEAFARYMHSKGHGKLISELQKKRIQEIKPKPASPVQAGLVSAAQRTQLWAIARRAGYTEEGAKALVKAFGFASSAEITVSAYDEICKLAATEDWAAKYNSEAQEWAQEA